MSSRKREMKMMNTKNGLIGHTTGNKMAECGGVPLTVLSKYIWTLKDSNSAYMITWFVHNKAVARGADGTAQAAPLFQPFFVGFLTQRKRNKNDIMLHSSYNAFLWIRVHDRLYRSLLIGGGARCRDR